MPNVLTDLYGLATYVFGCILQHMRKKRKTGKGKKFKSKRLISLKIKIGFTKMGQSPDTSRSKSKKEK